MSRLTVLTVVILLSLSSFGQNKTIDVPADKNLREVLANSLQYVEPDFLWGRVLHNDGSVSEAFLNYNLLLGEMHFILLDTETGNDKVLSLANPEAINFITIGKRLFIFDKRYGYMEVLVNGQIKLLKKSKLEIKAGDRPRDSYGYLPESASSSTLNYFGGENFIYAPDREEIIKANTVREDRYYAMKSKSINPLSSKSALFKTSAKKHRDELSSYQNSLKGFWNDEQNLIEYFKFANKLEKE